MTKQDFMQLDNTNKISNNLSLKIKRGLKEDYMSKQHDVPAILSLVIIAACIALEKDLSIRAKIIVGLGFVLFLATAGHSEAIKTLIERGADVAR